MKSKKITTVLLAVLLAFTFALSGSIVQAEDMQGEKESSQPIGEKHSLNISESVDKAEEESTSEGDKELVSEEEKSNDTNTILASPNAEGVIEIQSFEDLKKHLEFKLMKKTENDTEPVDRFVLKGGNYEIVSSFEIDLEDELFKGKEEAIKYGLISIGDELSIKGNGNTISFKQDEAVALFGMVNSPKYEIDGIKISYPKNVSGFAFAQLLKAKDSDTGIASAKGIVKNIEVNVGGSVAPLKVTGNEKRTNHFIGEFFGVISTGFSWYIQNTNIENIDINIIGNIGSKERPTEAKDMVAAYGFAHHFDNVPYRQDYNAETWAEVHDKGNPSVLKDAGHITRVNLNVGGNIQAYGNNTGYSAGMGQDMATAWLENINLKVGGDIITDLKGNSTPMTESYSDPYAFGFSDEVMNLTDSSLQVNNIIFTGESLPDDSYRNLLGAVANNNSKGNYINIKNNTINVKGMIEGKSNQNLLTSIGFDNEWNSLGKNGTNYFQESEQNVYNVGGINLEGDKFVIFNALGEKWRTGNAPLGEKILPEASLKNEKVKTGDITIKSKATASVSLLMSNASNAKNNNLDYGNINIKANRTNFYGMGNLQNDRPKENFYKNIAENNHLTMKNLNIESNDAQYISLMVGVQHEEQELRNNTVKAEKVNIKLNSSQNTYISGIAGYSMAPIDSCRVLLDSINVENAGSKSVFFGMGVSRLDAASIKNSGAFVDSDINVQSQTLYGGGFIGFGKNSSIEGNDFQVDGKNNGGFNNGTYGGFGGWLMDVAMKNNASLILNDFKPFVGHADGGSIENSYHYVNKKAPKFFSGLLASGENNPKIINSTLLVEKESEDTILYRKDNVSNESGNNYLVVVDNASNFNRAAYAISETTATADEMGAEIPVFKKAGEPIGKINIKARTFQDNYWNEGIHSYETGDVEKNFDYMTKNEAGTISAIGIDGKDIVSEAGKKGTLADYYHRHAGLVSDKGIAYDLLGIRGNVRFIVVYDGNGSDNGSVPVDTNSYEEENAVTVLSNGDLTREGYEFMSWNTKADGSGNNYKVGESFKIVEDTRLYAIWKELPKTVTFKDGDNTHASVKVETGKTIDNDGLTDESMPKNPKKSGYTFKEWNTEKDGKGTEFTGTTVVKGDMTVYAIYSMNATLINEVPTLELEDKTIQQGENLDLMSLVVSAKDKEDGDLIKEVQLVDNGGFDKDKLGKYIITFKVADKDGANTTKKATVTVIEKEKPTPVPDNNKPKPNPDNNKPEAPNTKILPNTGDSNSLSLYAMLMALSGIALVAAGFRKGRKES